MGIKQPKRILSLQFHSNYSYEEFVEGYRPVTGGSGFEVAPGSLKDFVENVVLELRQRADRADVSKSLTLCVKHVPEWIVLLSS